MSYTPPLPAALQLLDALELEQAKLLCWGVLGGTFSYDEVAACAEKVLCARGETRTADDIWLLIEPLLKRGWLWQLTDSEPPLYRTRLAEAVRLFAQLRQIFPGGDGQAWRGASKLVSDYRLLLRPRVFPSRDIGAGAALKEIEPDFEDKVAGHLVFDAILRRGTRNERRLAGFQVRATRRVLRALGGQPAGTIVCAGTGSGKTLAFYLPALAAIASRATEQAWTKCLALYPRTELLKDQFREALANTTVINSALRNAGRRPLCLGTLFGDTPTSRWEVSQSKKGWAPIRRGGAEAYVCPLSRCPACAHELVWLKSDLDQNIERLLCSQPACTFVANADDVRLTRESSLARPPDILFTTTEMLNQRLGSSRFQPLLGIGLPPARRPFLMLLDEVHVNEGAHGAHVAMLIRRWRHLSKAAPHIVGLSATLEDAQRFFADLVGISKTSVAEVSPVNSEMESHGTEYMLALRGDPSSGASLLSTCIQVLMLLRRVLGSDSADSVAGSRVFAFTDNLDVVNRLFHNLRDAEGRTPWGAPKASGVPLASLRGGGLPQHRERFGEGQSWDLVESLGHGLTPSDRLRVERTTSQDPGVQSGADIVVATQSLEVGFDDPFVGAVLQYKAPRSAAGFLQRKGRAGRQQTMRPWTVVVLSDYGRDRAAYESYEHMFSPALTPRYLPLANRAVLRMQATYSLFEWLGSSVQGGEPWFDLAAPAAKNDSATEQRQAAYVRALRELLTDKAKQRQFANHAAGALGLDVDSATLEALLWGPPRPVLMGAAPTMLRRLERSWAKASPDTEFESSSRWGPPVPDFVQKSLFGDLLVPEVEIRTGGDDPPTMLVAQALREFSPGRISRRFGIEGRDSHWINPGDGQTLDVAHCCPADARDFLGRYQCASPHGIEEVLVYRPRALLVSTPPPALLPSSTSIPDWRTQIIFSKSPHAVDVPAGSPWHDVIHELRFHTHTMGNPIELRRFIPGFRHTLMRARVKAQERRMRFVSGENREPAALGFVADVDAIEIPFVYPAALLSRCVANGQLLRGLRAARFSDLVVEDARLDGHIHRLQRGRLCEAYLGALSGLATEKELSTLDAAALLENDVATLRAALERMSFWVALETDDGDDDEADGLARGGEGGHGDKPKRLVELLDALGEGPVRISLRDAIPALWEVPDQSWIPWLHRRYKATLSAAMLDAFSVICPQVDAGVVLEDLDAHTDPCDASGDDRIWLTESTLGGGGAIEAFFRAYVEDPRRYFRLLETSLGPSALERVTSQLERVVEQAANLDTAAPVPAALRVLRECRGHAETLAAIDGLRTALAGQGIIPDPSLVVAMSARLLRPGARPSIDAFLARSIRDWRDLEDRLGFDVDVRVVSALMSRSSTLDEAVGLVPPGATEAAHAVWRYSLLRSLLWTRGGTVRSESLRVSNQFLRAPICDRLLVIGTLPRTLTRVDLDANGWFGAVAAALTADGVVELAVVADGNGRLADAIRHLGAQAIDTGGLLVHGRLVGLRREALTWIATFELPEAFQ